MLSFGSMYYMNKNLYRYSVGRKGQTVDAKILMSKIDDHIKATQIMLSAYNKLKKMEKEQERYCLHFLDMMMCIADCVLDMDGSQNAIKKKNKLWKSTKILNPVLYKKLKHSFYGRITTLPGKVGRKISKTGYGLVRRLWGFD